MNPGFQYRETAIRGAGPVRLVISLYEQAIEDVRRAMLAMESGQIEARTVAVNHALKVIGQLQGTLDMERGGSVAKNLNLFYHTVRKGLMEAQFQQSARLLEQQASHLALVHEAWLEVERATASGKQSAPEIVGGAPTHSSFSEWNA